MTKGQQRPYKERIAQDPKIMVGEPVVKGTCCPNQGYTKHPSRISQSRGAVSTLPLGLLFTPMP